MTGVERARAFCAEYNVEPTEVDGQFTLLRLPDGGAMLINFRTIPNGNGLHDESPAHDCADVSYWAPDGTRMSLGVFSISDGARGPSPERKGHGWDGGDMVVLLADHEVSEKQTAARRNNGEDY